VWKRKKLFFLLFHIETKRQKFEANVTGNKLNEAKQLKRTEKLLSQENAEGRFILVSVPIY
jgi:hypothetical protein